MIFEKLLNQFGASLFYETWKSSKKHQLLTEIGANQFKNRLTRHQKSCFRLYKHKFQKQQGRINPLIALKSSEYLLQISEKGKNNNFNKQMRIFILVSLLIASAYTAISPSLIPSFNSTISSSGSSALPTDNSSSKLNYSSYNTNFSISSSAYMTKAFPKANLSQFIIDRSFSYNEETKTIQNAINQTQSGSIVSTRSIDSYFIRLPTLNELDQLILSADSFALIKTIQSLNIDQSLNCSQVISYLLEMLGRTRSALEKKRFIVDQLNIIITYAKQQISKLESDLYRVTTDRKYLPINSLDSSLKDYLSQLQSLYKDFNNANSMIGPKQAEYAGYNKQIDNWNNQNQKQRAKMLNDKLKISEIQSKIKDLQSQLMNARNSKAGLEGSVNRSMAIISKNQRSIQQNRDKLRTADFQINAMQNNIDSINRKIKNLEVNADRTRTNLAAANLKDQALAKQAKSITEAISVQKKKILDDEINSLKKVIDSLSKLEPTILSQIDRQYYYCFGDGVQTIQSYTKTIYVIKGDKFAQYIKNAYNDKIRVTSSRYSPDFSFQVVDPFSQTWNFKYGYPFASAALGSANYQDVSLAGDFTCLNPSQTEVGQGIIRQVRNGMITIFDNQGRLVKLKIGACSRIQSTKELPSIGQNIAWRGISSDVGYNIYTITCW